MRSLRDVLFRVARTNGVRTVRRTAGRFGAPGLNSQFEALRREVADSSARVDRHMPAVLNAIASANGTARLLRRELDQHVEHVEHVEADVGDVRSDVARIDEVVSGLASEITRLDGHIGRLNGHIQDELWP